MFARITITLALFACATFPASAGNVEQGEVRHTELPPFMGQPVKVAGAESQGQSVPKALWIFTKSEDTKTQVSIEKIIPSSLSDLVLLNAGHNQNIRPGMLCLVERQGQPVAHLSIAESTSEHAIGLILAQGFSTPVQSGDTVKIKTVHFN